MLSSDQGCPELAIIELGGRARAVVWPGVGAIHRSMHVITLDADGSTVPQSHPSDAVYHVCEGAAMVTDPAGVDSFEMEVGSMLHIDAGTAYRIKAGAAGVVIVGGPCPPDRGLLRLLGVEVE